MNILVTGAAGFVGHRLCNELVRDGHQVRGLVRTFPCLAIPHVNVISGDITDPATANDAVVGIDIIVHLAARAHVMNDTSADPLEEYRRVNVEGTRILLDAATDAGVSCVVFASSVKAVGEASDKAWNSAVAPAPVDPYGISKREAELVVADAHVRSIILRFPLIYGPGVRGNVLRLFKLIGRGRPIPIGAARNARSILFVGNATAAIRHVIKTVGDTGGAPSGPFFVADASPVSTGELIRDIAWSLGVTPRTIPIPVGIARRGINVLCPAGGRLRAKGLAVLNRLTASLEVDAGEFFDAFQFTPPFSTQQGLIETARWFQTQ